MFLSYFAFSFEIYCYSQHKISCARCSRIARIILSSENSNAKTKQYESLFVTKNYYYFFRREERRRDVSCELSFAITFTIWQTWTSIPLRLLECWKFRKQTRVVSVCVRLNSIGSVLCFMLAPNCTQITIPAACACIDDVNRLQTCRIYPLLSCYNGQFKAHLWTHLPAYGLVYLDSNENSTEIWLYLSFSDDSTTLFPFIWFINEVKQRKHFLYLPNKKTHFANISSGAISMSTVKMQN